MSADVFIDAKSSSLTVRSVVLETASEETRRRLSPTVLEAVSGCCLLLYAKLAAEFGTAVKPYVLLYSRVAANTKFGRTMK